MSNTIEVTQQHLKKRTWNESPRIVLSPLTSCAQSRWAGTCPSANQCVCLCVCVCARPHLYVAKTDKTSRDMCPLDVTIPWRKAESGRTTTALLCDSTVLSATSPHRPSALCSVAHCCHTPLLNSHDTQCMHTLCIPFFLYFRLISCCLHCLWRSGKLSPHSPNTRVYATKTLLISECGYK